MCYLRVSVSIYKDKIYHFYLNCKQNYIKKLYILEVLMQEGNFGILPS